MANELVWLFDERTFAWLKRRDAYTSVVRYSRGGIDYEVLVDNDDYKYINSDEREDSGAED